MAAAVRFLCGIILASENANECLQFLPGWCGPAIFLVDQTREQQLLWAGAPFVIIICIALGAVVMKVLFDKGILTPKVRFSTTFGEPFSGSPLPLTLLALFRFVHVWHLTFSDTSLSLFGGERARTVASTARLRRKWMPRRRESKSLRTSSRW